MVATIIYWAVVCALLGWGAWNIVFSAIYVHNREFGNLWFFAILNALTLIFTVVFDIVMSNTAWQKYWFVDSVTNGPLLFFIIIGYVVLILLQLLLGREKKSAAA
ncbi:hypothetical protein [Lacticaseibacillus parakribbianus]|uniref:hypothetical protein n=1 Tax=Lacticaseibacillus parakribbianus TaxID=2970927 RepID=UPI0021CB1CC8|nr:hypothetical protein [Lacticaseibacillus parakribbianus]